MISINTFSLMDNFQRVLWEFHDDKLTLKIKSLNLEIENEIKYEKIKEIRSTKAVDLRWLWIVVLSAMLISTPKLFVESSSTVILIEKVIFVFLLALIIQAFRKYEYCSFLDADGKYLASIRVSKKEQKTLLKGAINLIKRNTEIINESILEEPLPNTPPVFEIVEFDFPNYLNKSRVRFYENEIIEVDKGLCREEVSKTKYREFSGRTQIVKTGNNNWDSFFCFWLYFVAIVNTTAFVFFSRQIAEIFVRGIPIFLYLLSGFLLLIPISFLKYIKNEALLFYNNNDQVLFWVWRHSKDREKLDQIIKFVEEKVSSSKI